MSEQPPALSKGLFGYRRSSVNQLLSDRDVMLRQAEGRVKASEAKASRLESEMASLQESHAMLQRQLEGLSSVQGDVTTRFLNEELATILAAAEESAIRIVERARASTQQQVAEAERVWREAQTQVSRFNEWRDRVDPALRDAQVKIEEVRDRIEEVPNQIRLALAPLADAVASLNGDLSEVSGAPVPPLLAPPVDEETDESLWTSEPSSDEPELVGFEVVEMVEMVDVDVVDEAGGTAGPVDATGDAEDEGLEAAADDGSGSDDATGEGEGNGGAAQAKQAAVDS
jgi:hypothetical protein